MEHDHLPNLVLLGPLGTYSHQVRRVLHVGSKGACRFRNKVADNAFGNNVNYVERQTITGASQLTTQQQDLLLRQLLAGVFDAVSDEHPFAVIPQENTIYGSVIETYDCFRSPRAGTDVYVRGEVTLAVQHCLLGRKGVKPQNIRRIISHDQVSYRSAKTTLLAHILQGHRTMQRLPYTTFPHRYYRKSCFHCGGCPGSPRGRAGRSAQRSDMFSCLCYYCRRPGGHAYKHTGQARFVKSNPLNVSLTWT